MDLLRFANEHGIPAVLFGQGSSLEGHVIPSHVVTSLELNPMGEILEVRPEDLVAKVQPGVTHGNPNERLKEQGLSFPVDPSWDASIGGMAATNASGTNAIR